MRMKNIGAKRLGRARHRAAGKQMRRSIALTPAGMRSENGAVFPADNADAMALMLLSRRQIDAIAFRAAESRAQIHMQDRERRITRHA